MTLETRPEIAIEINNQAVKFAPLEEAVWKLAQNSRFIDTQSIIDTYYPNAPRKIGQQLASALLVRTAKKAQQITGETLINAGSRNNSEWIRATVGEEAEAIKAHKEVRAKEEFEGSLMARLLPMDVPVKSSSIMGRVTPGAPSSLQQVRLKNELKRARKQIDHFGQVIVTFPGGRDAFYMRTTNDNAERIKAVTKNFSPLELQLFNLLSQEDPMDTVNLCEEMFPDVDYEHAKKRVNKIMGRLRDKLSENKVTVVNIGSDKEPEYLIAKTDKAGKLTPDEQKLLADETRKRVFGDKPEAEETEKPTQHKKTEAIKNGQKQVLELLQKSPASLAEISKLLYPNLTTEEAAHKTIDIMVRLRAKYPNHIATHHGKEHIRTYSWDSEGQQEGPKKRVKRPSKDIDPNSAKKFSVEPKQRYRGPDIVLKPSQHTYIR